MQPITRRVLAGMALGTCILATFFGLSRAPRADVPPLSPNGQAFVDTLQGFSTLQTAVLIDPWTGGRGTRLSAVLHLRNDGAMALDGWRRSRYAFDGTRFTSDAYGSTGGPTELWPELVPLANAVFAAVRGGNVTWTSNSPFDYGLEDGQYVEKYDWAEIQFPASVLSGYRIFFCLDGDHPSSLTIYRGTRQAALVVFRTWIVNPPIPPQAFSPNAPPIQVEQWHDPAFGYTPK